MTAQEDTGTVEIPSDTLSKIEERVSYTEFDSASDYIGYVLNEILYQIEQEDEPMSTNDINEEQVQERLKSLGYLNE